MSGVCSDVGGGEVEMAGTVECVCPGCRGRRFRSEVLAVRYDGYDIAEVLAATVDEALTVFRGVRQIAARLQRLSDVGLGYLPLGQPATTISGGEAQRLKPAKELGRRATGRTLYLLDEPTTGLHATTPPACSTYSNASWTRATRSSRASTTSTSCAPRTGSTTSARRAAPGEGGWWPREHRSRSRGRRRRRTGAVPGRVGFCASWSPMSEPDV